MYPKTQIVSYYLYNIIDQNTATCINNNLTPVYILAFSFDYIGSANYLLLRFIIKCRQLACDILVAVAMPLIHNGRMLHVVYD